MLTFKTREGWEDLGKLPAIKAKLKLQEIRLVSGKEGKKFVLFIQPNGQYATAKYDTKNSPKLADAHLWEIGDGEMLVGLASYESTDLDALDSL